MVDLNEAFKSLDSLNEDSFVIDADDGIDELKSFIDTQDNEIDLENIIDPLAETEEDVKDSYLGKAILECQICKSLIYKAPEEVVLNEDKTLANETEACPYCQSIGGYKVVGQVVEFKPENKDEVKVEVETKETEPAEETEVKETEKVEEDLTNTEKRDINEDIKNLTVETEDQKITVSSEDKEDKEEDKEEHSETIAPVEPEVEDKFEETTEIDDFDDDGFNKLGEGYLKEVYENVKSFKTTASKLTKDGRLVVEGLITFKSGKSGKTEFVFEKISSSNGKLKFIGENLKISNNKKAFRLNGTLNNKKFVCESLNYSYFDKDKNGKAKRLYNTVRK